MLYYDLFNKENQLDDPSSNFETDCEDGEQLRNNLFNYVISTFN